jgi:hypothetical protein
MGSAGGPRVGFWVRRGPCIALGPGVPRERLPVGGGRVTGRGHSDRAWIRVGEGVKEVSGVVSSWLSSGLRVLAAHDQVRWDLGLLDVGGGC